MTFDDFFLERFEHVRRGVYLVTRAPDVADDATQEAFSRAFARWSRVRDMDRPAGWVFVVAMNVARAQLRRRGVRAPHHDAARDGVVDVATSVTVKEALSHLPDQQRAVVVLRYYADLPLADIADALNIALGTVKSTLHAAHKNLGVELAEEHADAG